VVYGGSAADTRLEEAPVYAFVILLGLGLGLGVVVQVLAEVLPFEMPRALTRTLTAALAIGLAWTLDYSVFDAFGQPLRESWMHPVATGIVLTAVADLTREMASLLSGLSRKTVEEAAEIEARIPRAA
jgi:hypothetical protein